MEQNFRINNMYNATIVGKGVSDKDRQVYFTRGKDAVNHIISEDEFITDADISIVVIKLDSYTMKNGIFPTNIKIDTEGAEESIISGAEIVLSNERLNVIMME